MTRSMMTRKLKTTRRSDLLPLLLPLLLLLLVLLQPVQAATKEKDAPPLSLEQQIERCVRV